MTAKNAAKARYLVVADGAGEYDHDFTVTWVDAESATAAAEFAVSPEQGYGRGDDGKLYVIHAANVHAFSINQRFSKVLTKVLDPTDVIA